MRRTIHPVTHRLARLSCALLFGAAAATGHSAACDPVPEALVVEPEALLARTRVIVLAEALPLPPDANDAPSAATPQAIDARRRMLEAGEATERTLIAAGFRTLRVVEYLKGEGPELVMTALLPAEADASGTDFDAHRDRRFWEDASAGRAEIGEDCRLRGDFDAGQRYLLFLGTPHVKGFEHVKGEDDAWLAWVRSELEDGSPAVE